MHMKKIVALLFGLILSAPAFSQNAYWVCFTDKSGCEFNPYTYFDAKAIERRLRQGIPLNDSSDYPLNTNYTRQIADLSDEVIGESRWLNAMAVCASEEAMQHIAALPFIKKIIPIQHDMLTASHALQTDELETFLNNQFTAKSELHPQLTRMGGERFLAAGIQGKGIRIAVLDAGFPLVDKHEAFRHLFESHRIIATYNFPKKQEDVFGWNSHGTMTLSCIAGLAGNNEPYRRLGLASEAEFLLARTEVNTEPKKEEVWWVMGLEWAEQHGANIVSSSLGYGDINHEIADLDGQSPISRAANMAAAKGILICNSAGNEGDSRSWPRIILPADADSVLTVGGINPVTEEHQDFSSYGPTADGRLKPNVCAYAFECRVAGPNNDHNYQWVAGTSFSCPLVAGFAACAWQLHPEYNAMQLKAEIEQSADLYPYFDYAMGYGVPQAAYFFDQVKPVAEKTVEITREGNYIVFTPKDAQRNDILYYHFRRADGRILRYEHIRFDFAFPGTFRTTDVANADYLCVHYKGYTETVNLRELPVKAADAAVQPEKNAGHQYRRITDYVIGGRKDNPSLWGKNSKNHIGFFAGYGTDLPVQSFATGYSYEYSDLFSLGLFYQRNVSKGYGWGLSLDINTSSYFTHRDKIGQNDEHLGLKSNGLALEFYQHFRLLASGQGGLGLDLGVVGQWNYSNIWESYIGKLQYGWDYMHGFAAGRNSYTETLTQKFGFANPFTLGARLRISYGSFALFAQYDFTDRYKEHLCFPEDGILYSHYIQQNLNAFRLKIGLQIRY